MNLEKDAKSTEYVKGFSKFSEYIGSSRELAIFRRFDVLATRNLLYLQDQLLALESWLKRYDKKEKKTITDGHADPNKEALNTSDAVRNWESYLEHSITSERQMAKMEKILELRDVMKQYRQHKIVMLVHSSRMPTDYNRGSASSVQHSPAATFPGGLCPRYHETVVRKEETFPGRRRDRFRQYP